MTNDASGHDDGTMAIPDLDAVCERFRLGRPVSVAYLATGIMNRNWRLEAAAGTFAVKQLLDVAPDAARRSAAVCAALAATGLPACPPVLTRDGDPVLVVAGRAYLVSPWARGEHVEARRFRSTTSPDSGFSSAVSTRPSTMLTVSPSARCAALSHA
ncbi:hypothetical protein ACU686_26190 [Yinghuangia aomiensis]